MRQLEAANYTLIFDPEDLSQIDTAIINTCGFINDAKQESIDTILRFAEARKAGKLSNLYVMGCLSERYKDQLQKEIPETDAFFGVNDLEKIVRHLGGFWKNELIGERKLTTPSHYSYLKIAEGCDRKCSFCAIPMIRGKHISRPMEEVLLEAEKLAGQGVRELNVISQDTTYYGLDLYKERRLPALMTNLAKVEGLEWIRLHYTYPDGFPVELLQVIRDHPNICNYVDIPLQHISDRILRSMHRNISSDATRRLVRTIRETIPGVTLRTTLIVGYPGETEAEFGELKRFVEEARFDRLGVFTYSREEDTPAFRLKDSVSEKSKKQRAAELMTIQENISGELNSEKIGTDVRVIIDRREGDYFIARTSGDSPEVDNEVLIPAGNKPLKPGIFANVTITAADAFDLFAELK